MENDISIPITSEADIVAARQSGRMLAGKLGFDGSDLTIIATAISEVARNIVQYARAGEVILRSTHRHHLKGIMVIAQDDGPGITDIPLAMQDGYSTGIGLGLGLPGAKRLMDEFQITSSPERGTTVVMIKWLYGNDGQRWTTSD